MMIERRQLMLARRTARAEANALRRDLAAFASPAELLELSALLGRYDDADTEEIRSLVDLTRAA